MTWLSKISYAIRAFVHRDRVEQELDDEIRFHLEKQVEANVAAGMSPEEARYAALRNFGGIDQTKEECRDALGLLLTRNFLQDLRYGVRMLLKSPGFSVTAILTLALGIGANTAIFSVINSALLKPLPFKDSHQLVIIGETDLRKGITFTHVSSANFVEWKDQASVFDQVAGWRFQYFNLTGRDEPERHS